MRYFRASSAPCHEGDETSLVIARSPCDEAIQSFTAERFWIASRSLSSGRASRGPVCGESECPYSSLPRVIAMDASVLVRVHSMLRRR
ncbi:hypothetical protein AB7M17_007563 [Bradyrhizobium sp. USDA 377]